MRPCGRFRVVGLLLLRATLTGMLRERVAELSGIERRSLRGRREIIMLIRFHKALQIVGSSFPEGLHQPEADDRQAKSPLVIKSRRLPER